MNNRSKEGERAAAEDFRRQLQERLSGVAAPWSRENVSRWLEENPNFVAEVESVSWGSGKRDFLTSDEFREQLEGISLTSPHDEPFTHWRMQMLCEEVETVCRALGIPLRSGVAYGSTSSLEVDAARFAVHFTDASVITLSVGFISFCSHISKVVSLSLLHEPAGEMIKISFEPRRVFAKIGSDPDLKYYWTEVIGAYAFGSGPINVKHRLVPYPSSITRAQLLRAMEGFSIAHEYAHHIARHGKREVAGVGEDSIGRLEEIEADLFAVGVSRYLGTDERPQNLYSMSGAGAVLLLKCLECVRRARQIFLTGDDVIQASGSHPHVSDRIAAFDTLDASLPETEKRAFKQIRDNFAAIIDTVWAKLKPWYVQKSRQSDIARERDDVGCETQPE